MRVCGVLLSYGLIFGSWLVVLSERKFSDKFFFGAATSAYQVEGAWNESDKGPNVWDVYTHDHPEKIYDHSNGDVADDSYHLYHKDVAALKAMGATVYRFSLSWSRLLPSGFINRTSKTGTKYYNDLINELTKNGIQPFVTLFHWDLPEPLQRLGGFTNRQLVDIFVDYAEYAFEQFGNRVKYWATFNEINVICNAGYGSDMLAPALNIPGRAEYLCAHYMILAHAKAYRLYDQKYRRSQKGEVGIVHQLAGYVPLSAYPEHIEAANLAQDFMGGWVLNPIFSKDGDYPLKMKDIIRSRSAAEKLSRSRLPEFTPSEIELVKGSADFLGINYYTSVIYTFEPCNDSSLYRPEPVSFFVTVDLPLYVYQSQDWPHGDIRETATAPEGFRNLLNYVKEKYDNPPIVITENGFPYLANHTDLNDYLRVEYLKKHLSSLLTSILRDGVDVRGYLHWSLIDNFEWYMGRCILYGLYAVNQTSSEKERVGRLSSRVYANIIKTRKVDYNYLPIIHNDATRI